MADEDKNEDDGNPARFVYTEGELQYVDDDGKLVRVGDIPKRIVDDHE